MDYTLIAISVIGGVLASLIDTMIGINLTTLPIWKQFVHKSVYMIWGIVVAIAF